MALRKRQPTASAAREARRLQAVASEPVEVSEVDGTEAEEGEAQTEPQRQPVAVMRPGTVQPPKLKLGSSFLIGPVRPVWKRNLNAMFYGDYGVGKTFLAGTSLDVPSMRDVLFIAADPGDMSLTDRTDLDIITINKYDQLARIFEYLVKHCQWRDRGDVEKMLAAEIELKAFVVDEDEQVTVDFYGNEVGTDPTRTWFVEQRLRTGKSMDEPYRYRTVILDSISELHKYLIYKFTGVDIGKTKLDDEIEKMEEWPQAQELFRLLVRSFRDLPMSSIFVSAETVEPEKKNKRPNPLAGRATPKLAGQMASDVAGFLDIVGYLTREVEGDNEKRYLYLGAGYPGWMSKHRFTNLPDLEYLENPSMQSLLDLARKDAEIHASHTQGQSEGGTGPSSGSDSGTTKRRRSSLTRSRR